MTMTKTTDITKTGNRKCWHVVGMDSGTVMLRGMTKTAAENAAKGFRSYRACLDGYHFEACTGAAHSNPNIDHCGVCSPRWGVVMVKDPVIDIRGKAAIHAASAH